MTYEHKNPPDLTGGTAFPMFRQLKKPIPPEFFRGKGG